MGLKIYGIGAAQNRDNAKELIYLEGLDNSKLYLMKDEHPQQDNFFHSIGSINYSKKIMSERDCENDQQLRCWRYAQVPFLYAEGELADDTDHPNAKSAAALLKFTSRPDIPLEIGFSVDGGILERRDLAGNVTEDKEAGKDLVRTLATGLALTVKPCNPKCKIWLANDLTKSDLSGPPPAGYFEAAKRKQAHTSIRDGSASKDFQVYLKLEKLKKSLDNYVSGFTEMRCEKCGQGVRFFKASNDLPHKCAKCTNAHSLTKIWTALNK